MKREKVSRRKEQGADTKKKLYEIARRLFAEHSVDDVSVDAIVEAAGVSKGTFYVHFDSKDALLSALISDNVDKVDKDYEAFLGTLPVGAPASGVLLSLVGEIADVLEHTIGHEDMRALYKLQLAGTVKAPSVSSNSRALYQMFSAVLENGISRGEFRSILPVDELSRHLIMAMRGLTYEWCMRYPDFDLKSQARMHFEILLAGIKSES
jgi:AcrR family transcriptional regulator